MLILSRRPPQTIVINDNIRVTILSVGDEGRDVKIGIEAPADVTIHREEVWERIQQEKAEDRERQDET